MDTDVIRLECLKLAVSKNSGHVETLARAKEYTDFVTNQLKDEKPLTTLPGAGVTVGTGRQLGPS